ncbi:MAG: ATP-binding cassette domain-containing protein [Solirubrobacterales bacterium]|nr:ATP-binding cassette domain-containing protein [Solirubrobacterales bacterium]
MSARDTVTLEAGATPVAVTAGVVDVFFVPRDGRALPLVTLHAGAVVVAPASVGSLRVVPRLDAAVSPLPEGSRVPGVGGEGGTTGSQAGGREFVDRIAARVGDAATALTEASPEDLPGVLDRVLAAYTDEVGRERRRRGERAARFDDELETHAFVRARQDIEHPDRAGATESADPLATTLQILGDRQGFRVQEPAATEAAPPQGPSAMRLAALAHASGVRFRQVRLTGDWRRARSSPYLGFLDGGAGEPEPVALLPAPRGYRMQRADALGPRPLTPELARTLRANAFQLYPPLPRERAVTWRDIARVALRSTASEWRWTLSMALGVALLGLLTPILTQTVLSMIVPEGREDLLVQVGAALGLVALVSGAFSFVQYRAMSRVAQRATERVQPAFWDRILSMAPAFFRRFSTGDLAVRVMAVDALQQLVNVQVVGALLAAVFSLVYVVLMFTFSLALGVAGLVVLVATVGVLVLVARALRSLYSDAIDAELRGTSWIVQALTGIGKIRLAHAEARFESRYLDLVREQVVPLARMTRVAGNISAWIVLATAAAPALFFLLIGAAWGDAATRVDASVYIAFSTAYLAAFAAVAGLTAVLSPLASAGPILNLLRPLMEARPEAATHRADPGRLTGDVELRDVTFRYDRNAPLVLDRLSLHVRAGEMVAIVGPSGAGKSSALRMVLGFDEPDDGQVLIDGRDLRSLDLDLVRAQMGVVVQNGQLTRAPILKNILGSAGGDEAAAWQAAESAALADDIRAMPMKMATIVDPRSISGGQAQRILLARALARRRSIVLLDEATSALDNVSQATVTESLARLAAAKIVVAHRLSTVRAADRILVMVAGRIVEEGAYDELIARDGVFAELASRQMI